MMASLFHPYIDKENATSTGAGTKRERLHSFGPRPTVGKTFGSDSSLTPQTPRQALGNISNDLNAVRQKSHSKPPMGMKKPNLMMKKPAGMTIRKSCNTPGQPLLQKKKTTTVAKPLFKLPAALLRDTLPPIEQMHVFEEKELPNGLPAEHCLSAHLGKYIPMMPPLGRRTIPSPPRFDASCLTFENAVRPLFEVEISHDPMKNFESCLNLPPVETLDFLDINNIKLWDE